MIKRIVLVAYFGRIMIVDIQAFRHHCCIQCGKVGHIKYKGINVLTYDLNDKRSQFCVMSVV